MIEVVIGNSGLVLQYYGESIAIISSFKLRSSLCGLCGDFDGEMSNDNVSLSNCIKDKDFHI